MSSILKPIKPLPELESIEYRVERYGNLYVVSAENPHFHYTLEYDISVDLSLDREEKIEVPLWKPTFLNPFRKVDLEKTKITNEYREINPITYDSFEKFVKRLNSRLMESDVEMKYEDAEAFFLRVYEHFYQTYHDVNMERSSYYRNRLENDKMQAERTEMLKK